MIDSVAQLGCGLMGSALARTLVRAGTPVLAWNRTPQKALALESEGVVAFEDIRGAVSPARVLVTSLSNYADISNVLSKENLTGKVVINVTTGTAVQAVELSRWIHAQGAEYLDGSILSYPSDIGTDRATVLVSGDENGWRTTRNIIQNWGSGGGYLGERVELAKVLEEGIVGAFHIPALVAFIEAAVHMLNAGVPATQIRRNTRHTLESMIARTDMALDQMLDGQYATKQATLGTYARGARDFAESLFIAGSRADLLDAAAKALTEGEHAGWGHESIAAVAKRAVDGRVAGNKPKVASAPDPRDSSL